MSDLLKILRDFSASMGNSKYLDSLDLSEKGTPVSVLSQSQRDALRTEWQQEFTSPNPKDTQKFRFLVHGLQSGMVRTIQHLDLLRDKAYAPEHNVNLLHSPHDIHRKKLISCSIIDQDKRGTFGNVGLILRAPFENVLDMRPEDAGTNYLDPNKTHQTLGDQKRLMPIKLLLSSTGTGMTPYNEVVLSGETDAGKVEIVGVFIKTDKAGLPLDPEMAREISMISGRLNVPIVSMVDKLKSFPDAKLEVLNGWQTNTPYCFAFSRKEERYVVEFTDDDGKPKTKFTIINELGRGRKAYKEDAEFALRVIREELSEEQRVQFKDVLERLDAEKPTEMPAPPAPSIGNFNDYGLGLTRKFDGYFSDISGTGFTKDLSTFIKPNKLNL